MQKLIVALFAVLLSPLFAVAAGETVLFKGPKTLAAGEKLEVQLVPRKPHALALRVTLKDADFAGATILTRVGERAMLPYHAFGGDTRYDSVRDKPGMHPPVAKIQANYVLPADWTKAKSIVVTNSGPGSAIVESISTEDIGGHNLPVYENPIYFDFDVWRQAS